jgi:hypothetical protein
MPLAFTGAVPNDVAPLKNSTEPVCPLFGGDNVAVNATAPPRMDGFGLLVRMT